MNHSVKRNRLRAIYTQECPLHAAPVKKMDAKIIGLRGDLYLPRKMLQVARNTVVDGMKAAADQ